MKLKWEEIIFKTIEQIITDLELKYGNEIAQKVAWDITIVLDHIKLFDRNITEEKVKYILIHDKLIERNGKQDI